MENQTEMIIENKTFKGLTIQEYLSVGYVFLLIVGVFYETIYYKFLGLNILDYSSILDVLISPIAVMLSNLILGLVVIATILLAFGYMKLLPKYYNWLGTKKKYQEGKSKLRLDKMKIALSNKNGPLILMSVYVFALFVGLGIGHGQKTKAKIDNGDFELTHLITFNNGDQQSIKMLGKNSLYMFYVTKEMKEISIAPIENNIHLIQNLKKEEK